MLWSLKWQTWEILNVEHSLFVKGSRKIMVFWEICGIVANIYKTLQYDQWNWFKKACEANLVRESVRIIVK
jgi:hypothetical protein